MALMRESKFIEQNQEKWAEFEKILAGKKVEPEHLDNLFTQIMDDLSYSRTFYPNRAVRIFLNRLAQRVFNNIYKGQRLSMQRLRTFWTDELPLALWEGRQILLLSFCLFALAFCIGVVSSQIHPDFARVILGDEYIDMTLQNIEKGDPMAVYKQSGPFGMTVGIAMNNLFVALRTFVLGVLAAVGTVFIMLYNGIMVGAFQYFFVQQKAFWPSFLAIWIHGVPEISAIIIAGAAGMTAGSGLLFPGTYTRVQAFQLSVRRGFKIFLGIVPLILWAAFLEGFFTRHTDAPDALRGAFIATSLLMVLTYYVWYPYYRARKQPAGAAPKPRTLPPTTTSAIDFTAIKNSGEAFAESFMLLRQHGLLLWGILAAVTLSFGSIYLHYDDLPNQSFSWNNSSWMAEWFYPVFNFFDRETGAYLPHFQIVFLSGLVFCGLLAVERSIGAFMEEKYGVLRHQRPARWWSVPLLMLSVTPCVFLWNASAPWFGWFVSWTLLPFCLLGACILYFETFNPVVVVERTWKLYRAQSSMGLGLLAVHFGLLLLTVLMSPLWSMTLQFLSWWIPTEGEAIARYEHVVTTFTAVFIVYFDFMLMVLSMGLLYFSYREIADASVLTLKIDELGNTPRIRGLSKE